MSDDARDIISLYQRHATTWSGRRRQHLMEKSWLDKFLGLMKANPTVLDLGCGFGAPIAAYLAQKGCAVTGVDTSPELLKLAQRRAPESTWIRSDMRELSLGTTFNGILAWNSFFHLTPEDQRAMFPVFQRHAEPGAPLMFTSGPSHGEAIGTLNGDPLYHASLAPAEYTALLEAHGFDVIDHIAEDPDCGGHTVWLAQYRTS